MSVPAVADGSALAVVNGSAAGTAVLVDSARLMRADELAARWQVPAAQVYRLTRDGRLPAVRIGRYYRYRLATVEQWERDGGRSADG